MNFEKIITEIKSVREFTKQKVDFNLVNKILIDLDNLEKINDLPMEYVTIEDGKQFAKDYDGKIGYYGKLIEAPSYILVFGEDSDAARINAGYNLEWVRFSLFDAGVGSCWISPMAGVNYTELFDRKDGSVLLGCIAIGEEYTGIFKKNTDEQSQRKGVAEFVYKDSWKNEITWEELESLGLDGVFYLAKMAPSWGNCQPWAFVIENGLLKLYINKAGQNDYTLEAGIISLYFMKAAESKGLRIKASLYEGPKEIKDSYECLVIFSM